MKFEVGKIYGSCYNGYRIEKVTEKTVTYTRITKPFTPYAQEQETKRTSLKPWGLNHENQAFFGIKSETVESNELYKA